MTTHRTSETFERNAADALGDAQLRGALRNATTLFGERRRAAIASVEDWEGLRERARAIKAETLENLRWFEVKEMRGHIEGGEVAHFQVVLRIGFTLNEG